MQLGYSLGLSHAAASTSLRIRDATYIETRRARLILQMRSFEFA
jgi:hypothetical protein